jgi:signal transduction histidine kinase
MLNTDRLIVPTLDELNALPETEVQDLFHRELLRSPHAETMEQWLELGRTILDSGDRPYLSCQIGRFIASAEANNAHFDKADTAIRRSEEIASTHNLISLVAECKNTRGIVAGQRGNYAEAVVQFEQGLEVVNEEMFPAVTASLLTNLGLALDHLGHSSRAIEQHLSSIAIRERLGNHRGLASSYFNLGELYARRGDYDVAYEYYLRARDLQEQLDDVNSVARTFSSIAFVLAHTGEAEDALRYQNDAENLASNVPDARLHGVLMMMRGSILKTIGRVKESTEQLHACVTFARENGLQEMEVHTAVNIAKEHAERGQNEEAVETFEYALERAKDMGLRWLEAIVSKDLAGMYCQVGTPDRAPDLLLQALHIFRTNRSFDDYLSTLIDLANVYKSLHATADAFDALAVWAMEFRAESSRQLVDRINDIRRLHRHERTALEAESIAQRNKELTVAMERQRELVRRLEEVNAEKDEFMTIAAHDLKNPLGLVKSMLQTMIKHADTLPREDVIDLCNDMYTSIERMQSLVHTFLDMSRSADDPSRLRLSDINVSAIILRTASRYVQSAEKKHITLALPDYTEITAHADPAALEEIIDNLVSNAIKFCDAGDTISITIHQSDGNVCTHVRDTGPGLSDADKKKLFTKYGRLTPTPTANEDSSGLGLYLSLRLAERMSGTITCESEPGSGCDFRVCLPEGHTI